VIGAVVGQRYRIVRLVGAGGMGSVYEAADQASGDARVAVKVITAETARNATLMGRFEREARATMTLATPHIVRVLDAGSDAGSGLPFLVMEFLEGEDVNQLIKRLGPLTPDLALRIVAQACAGMATAHAARIIHRDIKPANFFLAKGAGKERVVKMLDFGIAKITRDPADSKAETAGLTRTGSMLGSPLYMSPEQARGLKEIDRRADIWSMGVVLYQALTGRTPHQDNEALGELIISICTEVPAPIQELAPWVPPGVAAIAHRAMRFDPAERFQSADEMLDAIKPLLPHGWAIEEAMLAPLTDAERSRVAPRFVTLPDTPPRSGRTNAEGSASTTGSRSAPGMIAAPTPQAGSLEGFGTTVGTPASGAAGHATAGGSSGSRGLLIAGALLALVAGGALAYKVTSPAAATAPAASASAAPAAPASAADVAAKARSVRLVILPEGATVEVDGAPTAVKDGVVEIVGALGSVHEVRVSSDGEQVTRNVVVAESGPVPAKVQLDVKAAAKPGTTPAVRPPPGPAKPPPASSPPDLRNAR
jgi:serine/threonine-protein kinase